MKEKDSFINPVMRERTRMSEKIRTRKTSITGKNIRGMICLGLFLVLGTRLVAGQWLYRRSIEVYTEHAYSCAQLLADNISRTGPAEYPETGITGEEYGNIRDILMTASACEPEFRDFYLVIPTEDDLICICEIARGADGQQEDPSRQQTDFPERRAYGPGEKEAMMQALSEEEDNAQSRKLFTGIRQQSGERLAAALVPVPSPDGEASALVGVDVSLTEMGKSGLIMFLQLAGAITVIISIGMVFHFRNLKRTLIRPIITLKNGAEELVTRLDSEEPFLADIHTGDELEALGRSFEEMDRNLKHYIRENTAITAERERLRTELELARKIQADMLPGIFPPFPDRTEFNIYASMTSAKEVGGDFYDFFLINDSSLALVIADVSGKGIPAALFMMMVKIMVQNILLTGLGPEQTMNQVNRLISANNSENMFVTVWLGILNLQTGVLRAANAGHEYPVLKRPGGEFELLRDKHGMAAGAIENVRYQEYELLLEPGSALFVYTDGLPEATAGSGELMGTERALQALNASPEDGPEEILGNVQRAVDRFVGDAPQFDDLTMMCLTYYGPAGS